MVYAARTEYELGVAVHDIVAADVDELHAVRVEHGERRVHVVDVVHAHAPALALLHKHTHHYFKFHYYVYM